MSTSTDLPAQRGLTLLVVIGLTLSALVPMVAPSAVGAVSDDIVISEFRTRGPGGGNDEFVEIHNLSAASVDVGGWMLRGSSITGAVSTRATVPAGTLIAPGCYLLFTNSVAYSGTVAGDLQYSTGITDDGGLAMVVPGGTIVDAVGMSASSAYVEPPQLPVLGADLDQGRERAPGGSAGHVDTDDNAADFALLAPSAPANSTSPCIVMASPTSPSGSGVADPASVMPGETTTLGVTVTAGTNPDSTGITVVADLSAIGGSPIQSFDDADGDGTFTFTTTVADGTAPGIRTLPATVADAEARVGAASIALVVTAPPTEIFEIQGAAHLSTLDGQPVFAVEGIVTAVSSGGFWMTDPTPDDDSATSDGIFVFRGRAAVGDLVLVDGTVDEFRPGGSGGSTNLTLTEIVATTVTVITGGHPLPTVVIGVDRLPPTRVIDDDSTTSVEAGNAVFDPRTDGIDFWESLEGQRLSVADAIAVGPTNGFGEIAVISQEQDRAGLRTARGGILVRGLGGAGDYRSGDFNPERLILDNVLAPTPTLNVGDEFITDPTGVLDYSFGNFKLLVTADPGRVDNGLRREVATRPDRHELTVATFNVENLSVVDADAKVNALASQIVNNLRSPDVVAIEEMQDNSGPVNDGVVAADLSWLRLINAIVAAGGPRYAYRQIDPQNNADGGAPGGNIRVGFLFRASEHLRFVDRPGGDATTDTDVVRRRGDAQLTISPGRVTDARIGGDAAFADTRKSLVGEFTYRGETVFIVVNHFSSKGDDRPLFGRFQPPYRLTEFESTDSNGAEDGWRHAQAQAINDFVDEILDADHKANVIVLGDINDFDFSETVEIIAGERIALDPGPSMPDADGSGQTRRTGRDPVMRTLFDTLPERERYSYVFDGNSQVLDQIIVSRSLWNRDPDYDVVHVNAEFFDQASDHDPSVMRVSIGKGAGHGHGHGGGPKPPWWRCF